MVRPSLHPSINPSISLSISDVTYKEQNGGQPPRLHIPDKQGVRHAVVAGEEEAAVVAPEEEAHAEPGFVCVCWFGLCDLD